MKVRPSRALVALSLLAIGFGVAVRATALERKLFFQDEAYSALRITGHREVQYRALFDGRVRPLADVLRFQRLDAGSSVAATLASIASEEPQRGPLYYALGALWVRVFGTSIAGFRSLAALVGVLEIAAAGWFGCRLFRSSLGGLVLAALVAVSPFAVIYSQQNREYGLLALAVFVAGACLLAALRHGGSRWAAYAVASAAGLAASPFFALSIVANVAYVGCEFAAGRVRRGAAGAFAASAAAGALLMVPWFAYAARAAGTVADQTQWGAAPYPLAFALTKWLFNASATFFDYEFADVRFAVVPVLLLPVVAAFAARGLRARGGVFAVCLALPTLAVFVGKDALAHSHFSTIPRYLVPVWLALEIAFAGGLLAALCGPSKAWRASARAALGLALVCGAGSLAADEPQTYWWSNNDNVPTSDVARVANAAASPVVTTSNVAITLSLVHYLEDGVAVQLHARDAVPLLPAPPQTDFLFLPSPAERDGTARRYPAASLLDVGPQRVTIVHAFHAALAHARPNPDAASFEEQSAANALWRVDRSRRYPSARSGGT